jgi:hypothetical protein
LTPAELIEKALRKHMRIRLGERAFEDIVLAREIVLFAAEAEDAARIAVDALAGAGLVVVAACHCGHAIGDCHSCGQPRCYYCDPGLGKHYRPMKCNERHAPPAAPPERNDHA